MRGGTIAAMLGLALCAALRVGPARADAAPAADENWAIHAQATLTGQATPGFPSPYAGTNSFKPAETRETIDATLYLGARPWTGAELWANGEVDQGFGLSNTQGIAGFSSGEAYKVGKADPYLRLQRLFFRQTINLGGEAPPVAAAANQLAGHQKANRLVLTIGKFSVADVFDTNAYAHDPRGDFLNWAALDTGSFDYAADAWGYSYGAAAELYHGDWTLRAGGFNLSRQPNGEVLETGFGQYQLVGEVEHRHSIAGHRGAVRVGGFANHGRFMRLADALAAYAASGSLPDPASLRRPATRAGAMLNVEQEASARLGLFLRAGISNGDYEAYDFTDIDKTVAIGGQVKGDGWGRADDRVGFAAIVNGISKQRQAFLAAGGMGILVGDGALPHAGAEWIGEGWYGLAVMKGVNLAADYQLIVNPGYNRDRGPAHVFALRLHAGI